MTKLSTQNEITAEIVAKKSAYDAELKAGKPVDNRTTLDYPPYRSSVLRHPTKDLHHVDPETIELVSPAFGHTDVAEIESDLTLQHSGEPLGERMCARMVC